MLEEIKNLREDFSIKIKCIISNLENRLSKIHSNRPSISLLENIEIVSYGNLTKLNRISTITIINNRTIQVNVWDKKNLSEISKKINDLNIGLSVNTVSNNINVIFPIVTSENKERIIKHVKEEIENSKVSVRNIRRDKLEMLKDMFKKSIISEDELFKLKLEIQNITDKNIIEIDKIFNTKKKNILDV